MCDFLQTYQKHVDERAKQGVVPKPLDAEQTAQLIELLKNPRQEKRISYLIYLRIVFLPVLMKLLMLKPVF